MILVDFNQVLFATFFSAVKSHTNLAIEEPMVRHMTLNMLRNIRTKFRDDTNFVICSDSVHNWRKDYFPFYKARRANNRSQSDVDWNAIYQSMDRIRAEIRDNFPYTYIQIDGCEADDIIGVLCSEFDPSTSKDGVVIVSGDKDFKQLQRFSFVQQYDPVKKRMLRPDCDPAEFLREHILRGDADDDIPNILSDGDTFMVDGKRQVPMTKKRLEALKDIQNDENHKYYQNWVRNKTLIDLTMTPEHLREQILEALRQGPKVPDRSNLIEYMKKHNLSNLLENLNDF